MLAGEAKAKAKAKAKAEAKAKAKAEAEGKGERGEGGGGGRSLPTLSPTRCTTTSSAGSHVCRACGSRAASPRLASFASYSMTLLIRPPEPSIS